MSAPLNDLMMNHPLTLTHFFERHKFWIGVGKPPLDLGGLFIREPQLALLLRFHCGQYAHRILLPLRRPAQDAVQNLFHLLFRHAITIARCPTE